MIFDFGLGVSRKTAYGNSIRKSARFTLVITLKLLYLTNFSCTAVKFNPIFAMFPGIEHYLVAYECSYCNQTGNFLSYLPAAWCYQDYNRKEFCSAIALTCCNYSNPSIPRYVKSNEITADS